MPDDFDTIWIPLTQKTYQAMFRELREQLAVFETISALDWSMGTPRWMTVWGVKGSDLPLIKLDCSPPEDWPVGQECSVSDMAPKYFLALFKEAK